MQNLTTFEAENNLTQKQIQIFKNHYPNINGLIIKLEGYTHFAVPNLPKENVNDFVSFVHKNDDKETTKAIAYVAPCHLITENGIQVMVFEVGSSLPVKARPIQLLFENMNGDLFGLLNKFFGF